MNRVFPRGYINLSGERMSMSGTSVTEPAFPRRSKLIDYVMGLGSHAGSFHPLGVDSLTVAERAKFNYWVLLGAQYK